MRRRVLFLLTAVVCSSFGGGISEAGDGVMESESTDDAFL